MHVKKCSEIGWHWNSKPRIRMGGDGLTIDTLQSKVAKGIDSSVLCQQHRGMSLKVKIMWFTLTMLPIHSLSFCDNSPNGETSPISECLAKLWTDSGTVQRIVQCWKSLDSTMVRIKFRVSLWRSVPTIKTAFVSDSFPPWELKDSYSNLAVCPAPFTIDRSFGSSVLTRHLEFSVDW